MPKIVIVHYDEDPAAIAAFKNQVLNYWNDHINFTKDAIVSAFDSGADLPAITTRLQKNADDISYSIIPYYGTLPSSTLNGLLKAHVSILGNIINAAKAGTSLTTLDAQWQKNSQDIANFLAALDPINWPTATTLTQLTDHMKATMDEINARAAQDSTAWIQAYDNNHNIINNLADYFSNGMVNKFPDHFVKYHMASPAVVNMPPPVVQAPPVTAPTKMA